MKKSKVNLIDIVIVLLFLLSVYFILTRIFGHSATDLVISVSLFSLLVGVILKIMQIGFNLNREFGEFKTNTINSFKKLKEDIIEIKKRVLK